MASGAQAPGCLSWQMALQSQFTSLWPSKSWEAGELRLVDCSVIHEVVLLLSISQVLKLSQAGIFRGLARKNRATPLTTCKGPF